MSMVRCVKRIENDPECIMGDTLTEEAVLDVLGRGNGGGDAGCLGIEPSIIHAIHQQVVRHQHTLYKVRSRDAVAWIRGRVQVVVPCHACWARIFW